MLAVARNTNIGGNVIEYLLQNVPDINEDVIEAAVSNTLSADKVLGSLLKHDSGDSNFRISTQVFKTVVHSPYDYSRVVKPLLD